MTMARTAFPGFGNPVDPRPEELREWAYDPSSVSPESMPPEWDLLVATNRLAGTLFTLAFDPECPARRFALHCLYIYAAGGIRTHFREHPKRKLRKFVETAERKGDETIRTWAYNTRVLMARPDLFRYRDWYEGALVRHPRRLGRPR